MEKKTTGIKSCERIFCETREHTIECDILLPDYYPEIEQVVSCTLFPTEENITLNGDKISVAGDACIRIVYTSADKTPAFIEHNVKYTKIIPCGGTAEGDFCLVEQNTAALQFKAVGPRKLEVRASVAIKSEIIRMLQSQVLCEADGDRMETDCVDSSYFEMQSLVRTKYEIKNTVSLPVSRDRVAAILVAQQELNLTDVRSASNKIMLKGTALISLNVLSKDGSVYKDLRYSLPFTEIKDAFGASEESDVNVCIRDLHVNTDLRAAAENEKDIALCVCFSALFCAGKQKKISYVRDAFSLVGKTDLSSAVLPVPESIRPVHCKADFGGSVLTESAIKEILSVSVQNLQFVPNTQDQKINLNLFADLHLYYLDHEGTLCFTERKITTDSDWDCMDDLLLFVSVEPHNIRAEKSDMQIDYSGTLSVEGFSACCKQKSFLSDLEVLSSEQIGNEKLIAYYASAGERLWDIAKTYKTSVSSIAGSDLHDVDVLTEDKLLVFPSKI